MRSWCQGLNTRYLIPSENAWFAKLSLAIAMNEMDEDTFDRQRPLWREGLLMLHEAQSGPNDRTMDEDALRSQLLGKG